MSKSLIITADDFGICQATNEAIEELAEKRRITSTSLIMPGKAVEDAVSRTSNMKDIGIGLHVTLTSDFSEYKWRSNAPMEMLESLVDEAGFFHPTIEAFNQNANSIWIISEMAAQFSAGETLGVTFDHLDSHRGTLYGLTGPSFLPAVFHFCAAHQLAFRFPKKMDGLEQMLGCSLNEGIKKAHTKGALFAAAKKVAIPDFVVSNPHSVKEIQSYEHLKQSYLHILKQLPEGVTEMFLHPSKETSEFYAAGSEWQKRVWEYQFLLDDDFLQTLDEEGIQLVTWKTAFPA